MLLYNKEELEDFVKEISDGDDISDEEIKQN